MYRVRWSRVARRLGLLVLLLGLAPLVGLSSAAPLPPELSAAQPAVDLPHQLFLPFVAQPAPRELTASDPALTASWQPYSGEGVAVRLPAGWHSIPAGQGGIFGVYTARFAAPLCASAPVAGCQRDPAQPSTDLLISVERNASQATPPGDESVAAVLAQGYAALPVTLGGHAARLFLPPSGAQSNALIVAEIDAVTYHVWFAPDLWASEARQHELALLLGTLAFNPQQAPAPFNANAPAAVPSWPLTDVGGLVDIDLSAVVSYAVDYGTKFDNSNGCYIYGDSNANNPLCYMAPGITLPVDGSEFVDCALKAGGLAQARCTEDASVYSKTFVRMRELYAMVVSLPHTEFTERDQLRPGDLVFFANGPIEYVPPPGVAYASVCWGGVVVPYGSNDVRLAVHSSGTDDANQITFDPLSGKCDPPGTPTYIFIRLSTDETPPSIQFTDPPPGLIAPFQDPTVRWFGSDEPDGSGLKSYTLRRRIDGGPLTTVYVDTQRSSFTFTYDKSWRTQTFELTAKDNFDNASAPVTLTLRNDIDPPTATFTTPAGLVTPHQPVTVAWLAQDESDGSGLKSYTLRRRIDGGPLSDLYVDVDPSVTSYTFNLDQSWRTQTFELTAKDNFDNVSDTVSITLRNDIDPPTAWFTNLPPALIAYGQPLTLTWDGVDNPGGSGIQGFTLNRLLDDGTLSNLQTNDLNKQYSFTPDQACQVQTYTLTAIDNFDLVSAPATLTVTVSLLGDVDVNKTIDAADSALVEQAWGLRSGQPGFDPRYDINADAVIDAADWMFVYRHQGDSCP